MKQKQLAKKPENSTQTKQKEVGMKVVLNGGNEKMESATIPWRWFFSEEAIERQPTHILIIDQNEYEVNSNNSSTNGERKIVEIARGSDFIQFTSQGNHRLTFYAMSRAGEGQMFLENIRSLLKKDCHGQYHVNIEKEYAENIIPGSTCAFSNFTYIIASVIAEVSIPKEFFATRNEHPVAKAIWKWANRWYETTPRDQCVYRKRLIWAFTAQPFLFFIGHLFKYILALICSFYLPLTKIVTAWAGYRPLPIFQDIGKLWSWKWQGSEIEWDPRKFGVYRQWKDSGAYGDRYISITGFEITAILSIIGMWFLSFWKTHKDIVQYGWDPDILILPAFCFFVSLLFTVIFFSASDIITRQKWWKDMIEEYKARKEKEKYEGIYREKRKEKEERKEQRPFLFFEWLKKTSSLESSPKQVEIHDLPDAYRGILVQKVRIKFWATKRAICKPFSKN